jgi:hypothetical protein
MQKMQAGSGGACSAERALRYVLAAEKRRKSAKWKAQEEGNRSLGRGSGLAVQFEKLRLAKAGKPGVAELADALDSKSSGT